MKDGSRRYQALRTSESSPSAKFGVARSQVVPAMHAWFRAAIIGCGVFLALLTLWLTIPEIARRVAVARSGDPRAVTSTGSGAEWAARLGVVRGDLWAEFALTYNELVWSNGNNAARAQTRDALEQARAVATNALTHSPHNTRLWLLLASLNSLIDQGADRAIAALRMSYYTGPNESEIIPRRLLVAVRPGVLADEELQQLFRTELRVIITRKRELKQAIVAAYREASQAAKELIEQEILAYRDQELLAAIRATPRGRN